MNIKLAVAMLLLLGLMFLGSATRVLAEEIWHGVSNGVEAIITKTDDAYSVTFTVEIVSDNPVGHVWGMGIIISTDQSTHDFRVFLDPSQGPEWMFEPFGGVVPWWDDDATNPPMLLSSISSGITVTGGPTDKIKTVTIGIDLLGGYDAQYWYCIQFQTNDIGTYPAIPAVLPPGCSFPPFWLWYEPDATRFAQATSPSPPVEFAVGGEWAPIQTSQTIVPYVVLGLALAGALTAGSWRLRKKN